MTELEKRDIERAQIHSELETTCKSGADVYRWICNQMLPTGENDVLSEEDLEFVGGGLSHMRAIEVVGTAYYDLCVKKKGTTIYTHEQIYEALNVCHRMNRWNNNSFEDIGKVTSLLVGALNK